MVFIEYTYNEKEISNYSLDVGTSDTMGTSETTMEMCGAEVEKIGDTFAAALASKAGAAFKVAGALASCAEIGYSFYKDGGYIRANTAAAISGVAAGIATGIILTSSLPLTAAGFAVSYIASNAAHNFVYNNFKQMASST